MAGHRKWANIQYRKQAQDKKRGKRFTKLIREITVAARAGGDPDTNPRLRLAMDKALAANMPKDNVERAIKRGSGEEGGQQLEEMRYEGYGSHGVAIMVDCLTDNRNRTVAEVRHAFSKRGGNLGADGSVAYLFNRSGVLTFGPETDEDRLLEVALEAGAEDVENYEDGAMDVLTDPEDYQHVKKALTDAGLAPEQAEVTMRPATLVPLNVEDAKSTLALLEALEDLDDVQDVYSNADIPEAAYAGD